MQNLILLHPNKDNIQSIQQLVASRWHVYPASSMTEASTHLRDHRFALGLMVLPPTADNQVAPWMKEVVIHQPFTRWVAIVAREYLQSKTIQSLIAERFYDYHTLAVDPQRLLYTLGHAHGMAELTQQVHRQINDLPIRFGMIGSSSPMRRLYSSIHKAADSDVPVMIVGESGTGKELAAKAIHEHSSRSKRPFVAVNCAALPANLIQAELFGYEKGAFTGAFERTIGRIEMAAGGTLFLDEIGDLPMELQANLLRFLQEKTIDRLGGRVSITVDARIIAATNADLVKGIKEQRFREDLFYRLNVLHIRMPALRERESDIEQLAYHYLDRYTPETRRMIKGFSQDALWVMQQHNWPGNIRELMHRIRRAAILGEHPFITPVDLGLERRSYKRGVVTLDEARFVAESEAITSSLRRTGYNISRSAQELGVSRVTLYRLMEKYSIPTRHSHQA